MVNQLPGCTNQVGVDANEQAEAKLRAKKIKLICAFSLTTKQLDP